MNIYRKRYNPSDRDYNFLKYICCDFKNLEEACKGWCYDHLSIQLKNNYHLYEYISIDDKEKDILNTIDIKNGTFSRIEDFDLLEHNLQKITVYAKDEFNQEKSINIIVQIKEKIQV